MPVTRRHFSTAAVVAPALAGMPVTVAAPGPHPTLGRAPGLSLAQWSLHRAFLGGERDARDFAAIARDEFALEAVEYVNTFYFDRAGDDAFFTALARRAHDAGVASLLVMCDRLGALGDPDPNERGQAVDRHRAWLDAAATLGCHSIRVNAQSSGSREEQSRLAADGIGALARIAADYPLNVLVENHGGLSSDGAWLAATLARVGLANVGSLPDFGNFRVDDEILYDRYLGVSELMPLARAVSAKSYDFDEQGEETTIDYPRMLAIVARAGYRGWIGIEYEGKRLSEPDGILATRALLVRHAS